MTNQYQNQQIGGPTPPINEPTITGRLMQILDSMSLAEQRMSNLRGHLFGEGQSGMDKPQPTTIRSIVDDLGQRLASLCGDLATVNQRMGCPPEPTPLGGPNSVAVAREIQQQGLR